MKTLAFLLDGCPQPRRDRLDRTEAKYHTEACMIASQHLPGASVRGIPVTNSVTNRLGNRGQCRATVTNFVTKLGAIQGNEITILGEPRAVEGN